CLVSVDVPQIACRSNRGAQPNVGIAMFRTPPDRLRAQHARNPNRRMGLLIGQGPGIHMPVMEMLALIAPGARSRPRLNNEVMRFVEVLAVISGVGVVEKLLAARPAHPARD